jgi:hypothetical protein
MGNTPVTGTEIAMSCVYDAFGFPIPTQNISLNATLGSLRQPPQALGVSAIPAGVQTALSSDMGGLDTADNYCCTLAFWCENADTVLDGWNTSGAACSAGGVLQVTAYFTTPCPANWSEAVSNGKVIYLNSGLTQPFTTSIGWYATTGTNQTVSPSKQVFQINGSGVPINLTNC